MSTLEAIAVLSFRSIRFFLPDTEIILGIEAITNLDDINLTGNSLKRNKDSLLDSEYSRISSHYTCRTEKGFVSPVVPWYVHGVSQCTVG